MARLRFLTPLVLLLVMLSPSVQAFNKGEGTFTLLLGGAEAGVEEFVFDGSGLETTGSFAVGGQTLTITSKLLGSPNTWSEYSVAFVPGAVLKANFEAEKVHFEVGPLQRKFRLKEPYLVLENNVFAHYEQIFGLSLKSGEELAIQVLVPSLFLANLEPVLPAKVRHEGKVFYQLENGEIFALKEYIVSMPDNLQIRLAGDGEGNLLFLEIPIQAVQVYREGYEGLTRIR